MHNILFEILDCFACSAPNRTEILRESTRSAEKGPALNGQLVILAAGDKAWPTHVVTRVMQTSAVQTRSCDH